MKYYEAHDEKYRELEARGQSCWDERAFDDFFMRPFLERALTTIGPVSAAHEARALEIGCGTGPVSCFLAARGYDVLGVDVSATAIRMAQRFAEERKLSARFDVRDVLSLGDDDDRYDLIVDGHCLHCIVYDDERTRLLIMMRRLLKPRGHFLVETMVKHAAMRFADDKLVLDDDGILWRYDTAGQLHPSRRLLAADTVLGELRRAGFRVDSSVTVTEERPGEPQNLQVILRPS